MGISNIRGVHIRGGYNAAAAHVMYVRNSHPSTLSAACFSNACGLLSFNLARSSDCLVLMLPVEVPSAPARHRLSQGPTTLGSRTHAHGLPDNLIEITHMMSAASLDGHRLRSANFPYE